MVVECGSRNTRHAEHLGNMERGTQSIYLSVELEHLDCANMDMDCDKAWRHGRSMVPTHSKMTK